jgi:hypothetical protein
MILRNQPEHGCASKKIIYGGPGTRYGSVSGKLELGTDEMIPKMADTPHSQLVGWKSRPLVEPTLKNHIVLKVACEN